MGEEEEEMVGAVLVVRMMNWEGISAYAQFVVVGTSPLPCHFSLSPPKRRGEGEGEGDACVGEGWGKRELCASSVPKGSRPALCRTTAPFAHVQRPRPFRSPPSLSLTFPPPLHSLLTASHPHPSTSYSIKLILRGLPLHSKPTPIEFSPFCISAPKVPPAWRHSAVLRQHR